ncbi:hypothetical protein SMITH_101 [Smithella sp. ME-1]|uniref:Uncharacterized protein n=1 Tax=hydrocarbon metagenome TaxID=938273 RepID=A0A0W8FM05_9ZZZZ|nr:hypothetical protein SMITH_101 [Smithella sp. ME-1]
MSFYPLITSSFNLLDGIITAGVQGMAAKNPLYAHESSFCRSM